jgi:hypothetical protein
MTIFARPTYGALDHPFTVSAIIGSMAAGAMACSCYIMRIDAGNTAAASMCAGLAVSTAVSIPLVITRSWMILRTTPWAGRQVEFIKREPEYPELVTYQDEVRMIPNLGELDRALKVMPSPFADWGIQVDKVPNVIHALLEPPFRATDEVLHDEAGCSRGEVKQVKKFLLAKGLGYPIGKTVELTHGGRAALRRLQALTHLGQ